HRLLLGLDDRRRSETSLPTPLAHELANESDHLVEMLAIVADGKVGAHATAAVDDREPIAVKDLRRGHRSRVGGHVADGEEEALAGQTADGALGARRESPDRRIGA